MIEIELEYSEFHENLFEQLTNQLYHRYCDLISMTITTNTNLGIQVYDELEFDLYTTN